MSDERVDGIELFTRPGDRSARRLMSSDDLDFLLRWPLCRFAACALRPERWPAFAAQVTSMKRLSDPHQGDRVARRIAAALGIDMETARIQELAGVANRLESNIHIAAVTSKHSWKPEIRIDGEGHLHEATRRGRGAVLWVAHFCFSSIISKMAIRGIGYDVCHMSRPEHGFSKSAFGVDFLNPIRCNAENLFLKRRIVIDRARPGAALFQARRELRSNGFVSITSGAWEGQQMARGRLLDGTFVLATGAPALAHLTGAALLPVVTVRDHDAPGYRVVIGPSLTKNGNGESSLAVRFAVAGFLDILKEAITRCPSQWSGWKYLEN